MSFFFFSWWSWLAVLLGGAYAQRRGCRRWSRARWRPYNRLTQESMWRAPVQSANLSKNLFKLNMSWQWSITERNANYLPSWPTFSKIGRTWPFHVVVLQRTAKKHTKICQCTCLAIVLLIRSLFGDVLVSVAVMVCFQRPSVTRDTV